MIFFAALMLPRWLERADLISAWFIAAVWLVHLLQAWVGMEHVPDLNAPEFDGLADGKSPKVTIVVPARNEAATIEPALRSLRNLDYPNYEVVAVNDRSEDATGEIMTRVAQEPGTAPLKVISIDDLPSGWLGKTHAMWRGAQEGSGDWILFTDADVVFRPDALRRAIACAEAKSADHFVLFPTMLTYSPGERMMLAVFQALVFFGHRPWKVPDPKARDHIGIGAFNMVRRSVYEQIGTYERMKLAVVDDMQLGSRVKKLGFRQIVGFGKGLASIHWATGAFGIVHNLSKNFFAHMRFSLTLAIIGTLGLLFMNVLPFVGLVLASGWTWVGYAIAVASIFAIYLGMSKRSDIPPGYIVTHAVSSTLIGYAVLRSAFETLRNGGVRWRGTLYPLAELRKGLE